LGKYKEVPDWIHEASISKSLLDISNELAEANRLKIIELRMKGHERDCDIDEFTECDCYLKYLEDKA